MEFRPIHRPGVGQSTDMNCSPRYAEYCGLEAPCDDIHTVLDKFSQRIGALQKGSVMCMHS